MNLHQTSSGNLLLKIGLMAVVALLLLIPLSMVKDQVNERWESMRESLHDIELSWGGEQCISGPKIRLEYELQRKDMDGNAVTDKEEHELYPADLKYYVDVETQILHRSIYDITVYNSIIKTSGTFIIPENLKGLDKGTLLVSISDLRGIEGETSIDFNGRKYDFTAANEGRAIETIIDIPEDAAAEGTALPFVMEFRLKGSDAIQFRPVGDMTEIEMTSDCSTPSFVGSFLPTERDVKDNGFSAKWIVSQINRGAYPWFFFTPCFFHSRRLCLSGSLI